MDEQFQQGLARYIGASPDAHRERAVVSRTPDEAGHALWRESGAVVACGPYGNIVVAASDEDIGDGFRQLSSAGDGQQVILALGPRVLRQRRLVEPWRVLKYRHCHLRGVVKRQQTDGPAR